MKKVLFIVGSLRKQSFNLQVAKQVEKLLEGKAEVAYLDYADVPFINQDEEYPAPAAVERVRKEIEKADGLWIFSPEYNQSYPGVLKNLLDWASRPVVPFDYSTTIIGGKKVTASGIGGKFLTLYMQDKLKGLLLAIGANVMPGDMAALRVDMNAWTSNELTFDDAQKAALQQQAEAFLAFLG